VTEILNSIILDKSALKSWINDRDLQRQNKTVETIGKIFQVKTTLHYFRFVELRPLKELTLEFSSMHTNILIFQFYFLLLILSSKVGSSVASECLFRHAEQTTTSLKK
jgi:hypothetical protein